MPIVVQLMVEVMVDTKRKHSRRMIHIIRTYVTTTNAKLNGTICEYA